MPLSCHSLTPLIYLNLQVHGMTCAFCSQPIILHAHLTLGMQVASLTLFNVPNRGSSIFENITNALAANNITNNSTSKAIKKALKRLTPAERTLYSAVVQCATPEDLWAYMSQLSRSYMQNAFNPNTPDQSGIYYQSWASGIKLDTSVAPPKRPKMSMNDPLLVATASLIQEREGGGSDAGNDGISAVTSQKWGTFRGLVDSYPWQTGLDLFQVLDMQGSGADFFEPAQFWAGVIKDLKARGF